MDTAIRDAGPQDAERIAKIYRYYAGNHVSAITCRQSRLSTRARLRRKYSAAWPERQSGIPIW